MAGTDPGVANAAPVVRPGDAYHVHVTRQAMACTWAALLNAGQHEGATEAAVAALDLVEGLEAQLTVYRDTSELSRLNCTAADGWVEVEARLFDLLDGVAALGDELGGALDVATGALIKAWGINREQGRVPGVDELAAALARSGGQWVQRDRQRQSIRFARRGVEINLGSVGKGYALDRCSELFSERGVGDYLLHGGRSSVVARGRDASSADGGWSIGIGDPLRPGGRLGTVTLTDEALSTSGAGTQFFRHEGKRYGHILDPRTGKPAEGVLSTTVVAPTATLAEALSTGFYVLGVEGAQRYCAAHPEIAALVIVPGGGPQGLRIAAMGFGEGQLALAAGLAV